MFITFEGIDGSGKSTQAKLLKQNLEAIGRDVVLESDPSSKTSCGVSLREIVLNNKHLTKATQHLLFCAARSQLLTERIEPALARGAIVICDRFEDSALVYQHHEDLSMADSIDYARAMELANPNNVSPDITFFITLNPVAAQNRLVARDNNNVFDTVHWTELSDRHTRYTELYDRLRKYTSRRIHKINGLQSIELMEKEILNYVLVGYSN